MLELRSILPAAGDNSKDVLGPFAAAGVDINAFAAQLQDEGARSFVESRKELDCD